MPSYTYRFYPAGMGTIYKNPKDEYIELFEENLRDQFYNSSDVFTVQEETYLGSGIFQNVDVRVNRVIDASTGDRVGDDFKKLLFSDLNHQTNIGWMYLFDDNYWIATNIDKIKSLTTSVTIRRCNNVLRWFDEFGGYYDEPCAINYLIKENRDFLTSGSNIVNPSGMIECYVQMNPRTNKIRPNQRFLFGNSSNWTAYRVEGGGINNFQNRRTLDNSSVGLMILSMSVDYINLQEDDVVNGIANNASNQYSITINPSSIDGSIGGTVDLTAIVKLGGTVVSRGLTWTSSNTNIATVSSSGLVTFVDDGSATIRCELENNADVYGLCSVSVSTTPTDTYQIVYSPEINRILDGESVTWVFYLYKNGVIQADEFTFSLNANSVPSDKYVYIVVDGNSVVVQNLGMYLNDTLTLTATSGVHSTSIDIHLSGKW